MISNFLDFEKPILKLESIIQSLQKKIAVNNNNFALKLKLHRLRQKSVMLTKKIFSTLNAWQITQLARHPMRPYTMDYIHHIITDFDELAGDRAYANDKAILGGIGRLNNHPVMIIGHQKGRTIKDQLSYRFGMPAPEGYRKAFRLMKLANQFNLPILTFIDTPGAYAGVGAEERNQSDAIAKNIRAMSMLRVPIICTIIGEGGSGGALAIGVGDKINMLQYSIYSVISPEGCAAILWKNKAQAPLAAEAMVIIASKLKSLNLIDQIIPEPFGGAHRDIITISSSVKNIILADLAYLKTFSSEELVNRRYNRLMHYGNN